MAAEQALASVMDAAEWDPTPTTATVGFETPQESEAYESETQEPEPNLNSRCESFFRESSEAFSSLGIFTLRHEIARVRLMTGDFVGIDYGEGVFKAIDICTYPESEEDRIAEGVRIENQKAERLRWIAALASVAQKTPTKIKSVENMSPEEAAEHALNQVHDAPLKDLASRAIALHFELRTGKSDEEIIAEIKEHLDKLIEKESFIYKIRDILSEAVFVENENEKQETDDRFKHSLHKKQRLQATLRQILERRAAPVV